MAKLSLRRIAPQIVEADLDAFRAIKGVPAYQSTHPRYTFDAVATLHDRVRAAQDKEIQIHNAAAASRDALVLLLHDFHEVILGVKDQVRAQFGADSDELASLGLKKKSERKTRKRVKKADAKEG